MANKLFLDTNILLGYALERIGELNEIEKIFNLAEENKLDLYFLKVFSPPPFIIYKKTSLILYLSLERLVK